MKCETCRQRKACLLEGCLLQLFEVMARGRCLCLHGWVGGQPLGSMKLRLVWRLLLLHGVWHLRLDWTLW